MQRQPGDLSADSHKPVEILLPDLTPANTVAADPCFLRQQPGRELFGAHFQAKDCDRALGCSIRVFRPRLAHQGVGGAKRDFGRQRRLAHAGATGEDHEVGRMEAAGLLVQVAQPAAETAHMPGALERPLGTLDRRDQRLFERDEAAIVAALCRELEQR